jgi:hypothetical protein
MAEELELTDPPTTTVVTTVTNYHVVSILMDREAVVGISTEPGLVAIQVKDNNEVRVHCQYVGAQAITLMKQFNTMNFSVNSMHKRVLQKLSADGLLPPGEVTGTPDPVVPPPL